MSVLSQFFGGIGLNSRTIPINFLVVGGGGGSGSCNTTRSGVMASEYSFHSGSGGGGTVNYGNGYYVSPGTVLSITVGAGGAGGVGSGSATINQGSNGGTSSIVDPTGNTFYAEGGGGGGAGADSTVPLPAWNLTSGGLNGGTGGAGGLREPSSFGPSGYGKYFKTRYVNTVYIPAGYPSSEEMIPTQHGEIGGFPGLLLNPSPSSFQVSSGGAGGSLNADYYPNVPQSQSANTGNGIASNIEGSLITYGAGNVNSGGVGAARFSPNLPSSYYNPGYPYAGPSTAATGRGSVSTICYGYNGPLNPTNYYTVSGGPGTAGNPGVVVIQYPTAFAAAPSFPGATNISPQTPGYRTYKFTSPGSITLPT